MAQENRGSTYSAPDPCADSLDKMTKRLTQDLRNRVRRLAHHTPLSPDWLEMADTLQHLASVAMMEEKDSTKKEGSIWERDELCVRYIIEEGKLNMLLRTMSEYKTFQYDSQNDTALDLEDMKIRAKVFEQSLGIVLKCSFTAVEALQTLDVTMLIEHIQRVLKKAMSNYDMPSGDYCSQEVLVLHYLELVLRHIDQLNEETVMKQIEQNDIVRLVLQHWEKFSGKMDREAQEAVLKFLSQLMGTEYFSTHRAKFIDTKEDKQRVVALDGALKEFQGSDQEKKKLYRSLSDNIIRFK